MSDAPTHMLFGLRKRSELNGTLGALVPCSAESAARGRVGFRCETGALVVCVPTSCARSVDSADIEPMREDCCAICLEPVRVVQSRVLGCGHAMHIGCIARAVGASNGRRHLDALVDGALGREDRTVLFGASDIEVVFDATRCPVCRAPGSLPPPQSKSGDLRWTQNTAQDLLAAYLGCAALPGCPVSRVKQQQSMGRQICDRVRGRS